MQETAVTPLLVPTPTGVLHNVPVTIGESSVNGVWPGFNARVLLDGDVKQQWGGTGKPSCMIAAPYTPGRVTGDMVMPGWCPSGVLVGRSHLRVLESHTAGQRPLSGLRSEGVDPNKVGH